MPPINEIKLLQNVDIKSDYKNTFTFPSLQDQINFFSSKAVITTGSVSYIRQDNVFRYDGNVEEVRNVSYMMYQNKDHNNKWFFAFVDKITFVSDNVAHLEFTIDVMQTWKFEIEYKTSYVEREHVADDSIGLHTVEEGLDIGEVVNNFSLQEDLTEIEDLIYVFVATEFLGFPPEVPSGSVYTGVYTGLWYFATDDLNTLDTWILHYNQSGNIEQLITIFTMPKALVDIQASGVVLPSDQGKVITKTISKQYTSLDGYSPKNNKMFCYPYNFLEVNNNQGQANIYRYEFFSGATCGFSITSNVAPSPVVSLQPLAYKTSLINSQEYLTLSDYPLSSWVGDTYNTWLAQNQVSNAMKIVGSVGALAGGALTGNLAVAGGGLAGLISTFGSFQQMSVQPDTAKGSTSGGGSVARQKQTFSFLRKTLRSERARMIDEFFTYYGYKVNRLKAVEFETRPYWNYLKLHEANVFGDFNNNDLMKIRSILENGITFWHIDDVGNYNRTNSAGIGGFFPEPDPEEPEEPEVVTNSLGYVFPLDGDYTISSPYGMRVHPITDELTMHYGVDLASNAGTPIIAVKDGQVTDAGYNSIRGYYIRVSFSEDGNDYETTSQHMQTSTILNVGDSVTAGDVIGYVGTSGSSTGNHLHFEIKENGSYIDPYDKIDPNL